MKEIIGIVAIIITVTVASVLLQSYLERTTDDMLSKLEELKESIKQAQISEDSTKAKDTLNEIIEKWDEISEIWSMVVMHQELDNIKLSILEVSGAIEAWALDDALEEINKTIFLSGHIKEKESFRLKNIF